MASGAAGSLLPFSSADPLAGRLLGMDAEKRALQTALKEAELDALRSRHAAELLRMEKTLQLLRGQLGRLSHWSLISLRSLSTGIVSSSVSTFIEL